MRGTGDEDWWSASEYSKQARLGTNNRTPCSYFNGNSEQITGITLEPRPLGSDIVEALVAELERQATAPERKLSVRISDPSEATVNDGRIDLDKLAMVVMGELAGGP
jgi:hypothetical protein